MAHYFFELVTDHGDVLQDDGGEEFGLVEEARGHALRVASELGRNHEPGSIAGKFITVLDGNGIVVFKTPLRTFRP